MTRNNKVRIDTITHAWAFWKKNEEGQICRKTRCGVLYVFLPNETSDDTKLAHTTLFDVDCMTCLGTEARR